MTNTGDEPTETERARLIAVARRRSNRLTLAAVVLLLASVPAAFAVGVLIADGKRNAGGLLPLLFLLPAAVGVAIALLVNALLSRRPSDGADPTSLRRVKAALRDGRSPDPRIDALARKEAEQQVRRRWLPWVLVVALAMQVLLAVGTDRTANRWVAGLGAAAWAVVFYQQWRATQRARRYLTNPTLGQAER
ncbi:hypothetical protein [Micromonospora sp. DH14]|uniref:hypothetical protein n=1 Tax=Micromonospora sp. DH14 TaxID=3040120 RepID=UPI0024427DC0|nr:hypothetical protein [Micromonospora sp. DH14]MDG9678193.1 hypothetical protein [Micromonospora sp. DH14]